MSTSLDVKKLHFDGTRDNFVEWHNRMGNHIKSLGLHCKMAITGGGEFHEMKHHKDRMLTKNQVPAIFKGMVDKLVFNHANLQ